MRDARASASVASASEARARAKNREKIAKNREKNAKNREIANGTRLLAHRVKDRCAGTKSRVKYSLQHERRAELPAEGPPRLLFFYQPREGKDGRCASPRWPRQGYLGEASLPSSQGAYLPHIRADPTA